MKAQLCLAVLLNVVIHHTLATITCSPENGTQEAIYHHHPSDCSKFLTCNSGALIEQQCPTGTYWNDVIKACDFPENVNCSLLPPVSSAVAEKCPEEYDPSNDVFLPHVDCSKFYVCTQEGAVEQNCPPGLHWSQNGNVCDWPQVADCSAGTDNPLTTATDHPSTTRPSVASSTTKSAPVGKCPEEYDPNDEVFLPHADCTKYYLCTWNGRPVEQSCPPGLDWNANANRCDWPAQAECRATRLVVSGKERKPLVLRWEELSISMRRWLK